MNPLSIILSILTSLGAKLLTETVIKKLILICMEQLVKKTETNADNKLLEVLKEAWGEQRGDAENA